MMEISVSEAKAQLTELVRRAEAGDHIVLTRHGQPAARLVAVKTVQSIQARRSALTSIQRDAKFKLSVHAIANTSALMSILLDEPASAQLAERLTESDRILICSGNYSEALIVAQRRHLLDEMNRLVEEMGMEVIPLDARSAKLVALAYAKYGRSPSVRIEFWRLFCECTGYGISVPLAFHRR